MSGEIIRITAEHFGVPVDTIKPDSRFSEMPGGADSLTILDLLFMVENETGRRLDERKLTALETVSDLIGLYEASK